MKTIIVTCFQRFGSYPANSSELAARAMDGNLVSGYHVDIEMFPADIPRFDRAESVFEKARRLMANGIICLGMDSGRKSLCIEYRTVNRLENEKYCPPELNRTQIDLCEPYGHWFCLDLTAWKPHVFLQACAMKGIPAEVTGDPGSFCCNHLMYQMDKSRSKHPWNWSIPWIFIHLPCSPECVPEPSAAFYETGKTTMPVATMVRGIKLLLETATLRD